MCLHVDWNNPPWISHPFKQVISNNGNMLKLTENPETRYMGHTQKRFIKVFRFN